MRRSGAFVNSNGVEFVVWAPRAADLKLHIVHPFDRLVELQRHDDGYSSVVIPDAAAGTRYFYSIDGNDRPDPASRFQPDGVHGPSEVVADTYQWNDAEWKGVALSDYVIYELHVGTFTREGTLDAAVSRFAHLRDLGITAIELMPVAQFPGSRNWGYDGVYPNAVQSSYGGPDALKRFVDAAHDHGLAVILDVVYNHLGPEGNYFSLYAPYFTDVYKTPWGEAMNFDGPGSDEVRAFFINNALQWCRDYHIDALRLDAVHAIIDRSARPFLLELSRAVHEFAAEDGVPRYLIAESDLNDPRLLLPEEQGGFALDAQWADDFHHALHVELTGERRGYYVDFHGAIDLPEIITSGWLFDGRYSPSRERRYGAPPVVTHGKHFVVCAQNHDQIGNRMLGDRLTESLSFAQVKVAMGLVLTAPFLPLLFMGEEYAETAPFRYFTSHGDEALIEAVRKGRAEEFAAFDWQGEVPDPHAESTFNASKLDFGKLEREEGAAMFRLTRKLLTLRREHEALRNLALDNVESGVLAEGKLLWSVRRSAGSSLLVCANLSKSEQTIDLPQEPAAILFDSEAQEFGGRGGPVVIEKTLQVGPHRILIFEVR